MKAKYSNGEYGMNFLDEVQQERVTDIIQWALEHGSSISYLTLLDLMKYEKQPLEEDISINNVIYELSKNGISVKTVEEDESYSSNEDSESFVPALVNIVPVTQNVSNLMERLEHNEIDLSPVFQRRMDLWDDVRQSRLIESLMLRIPIPSFYFDMVDEDKWKVIDGLQRLTTFRNYLIGELIEENTGEKRFIKRRFQGMQFLKDFEGLTFDELPRQYMRRIKEASVTVLGVQKGTPDPVVYNIFRRINTGGLVLEPQEIRNAMYHGQVTELARKLAESEEFLRTTQYAIGTDRLLDQEYVVRFMAFTELDINEDYVDDIDSFLIAAMKRINTYDEIKMRRIETNFLRVMKYSEELLDEYAFRRVGKYGRRGPINKALFELFSVCFTELEDDELDTLILNKKEFMKAYRELFLDESFNSAIKSGKKTDCIRRINKGREMIRRFI